MKRHCELLFLVGLGDSKKRLVVIYDRREGGGDLGAKEGRCTRYGCFQKRIKRQGLH